MTTLAASRYALPTYEWARHKSSPELRHWAKQRAHQTSRRATRVQHRRMMHGLLDDVLIAPIPGHHELTVGNVDALTSDKSSGAVSVAEGAEQTTAAPRERGYFAGLDSLLHRHDSSCEITLISVRRTAEGTIMTAHLAMGDSLREPRQLARAWFPIVGHVLAPVRQAQASMTVVVTVAASGAYSIDANGSDGNTLCVRSIHHPDLVTEYHLRPADKAALVARLVLAR